MRHAADGPGPAEGEEEQTTIRGIVVPTQVDLLSAFLRQGVTGVAGGAGVDGGMAELSGDMRGDAGLPEFGDKIGAVLTLVGPEREAAGRSGRMAVDHVESRAPFGMAVGLSQVGLHDQTVAVFHQRRRRENGPPDHFLTLLHP